jgi:hypothetical protein
MTRSGRLPSPYGKPRLGCLGNLTRLAAVLLLVGVVVHEFLRDGRVNLGAWPAARETIPFTITPGSWSAFEAACRAPS